MSLDWPVGPITRFDQSRPSSSPEDPNDEQRRGAVPASTHSRWRQDALQPPGAMYYLEHQGSRWIGFFLAEKQVAQTQIFQEAL